MPIYMTRTIAIPDSVGKKPEEDGSYEKWCIDAKEANGEFVTFWGAARTAEDKSNVILTEVWDSVDTIKTKHFPAEKAMKEAGKGVLHPNYPNNKITSLSYYCDTQDVEAMEGFSAMLEKSFGWKPVCLGVYDAPALSK